LTERVLVTGATGFIGYHLVRALLAEGAQVTCLIRPTSNRTTLENLNISFARGDVTLIETLTGPVSCVGVVYHLAGMTSGFHARDYQNVNELGTANIARACAQRTSPPTLIVVSSIAAAGPSPSGRLLSEENPPSPISSYGRSKLAGEKAAEVWAREVPITIVRPPIVFGEYDRDVFKMFATVSHGWHLVPGIKDRYYSFIHAGDLSRGLILAAHHGERLTSHEGSGQESFGKGVYFLSTDEHQSYADFGRMLAQALGRKGVGIIRIPIPATWLVGAVSEMIGRLRGRPSIVNLDKAREAAAGSWVCSADKARRQLGFEIQVSLEERLSQTVQWYRDQGWL
jgi:nucleoside-diphosphate-sugar epimerase